MSTLSPEEQALLDWARSAVPRDLWLEATGNLEDGDLYGAVAKALYLVQAHMEELDRGTFIKSAEDAFLDQHARDRGTLRQNNEGDQALRDRLRNPDDSVTEPALLEAVNAVLASQGIASSAAIVELRTDKAFMVVLAPPGSTFDVMSQSLTTTGWATAYRPGAEGLQRRHRSTWYDHQDWWT